MVINGLSKALTYRATKNRILEILLPLQCTQICVWVLFSNIFTFHCTIFPPQLSWHKKIPQKDTVKIFRANPRFLSAKSAVMLFTVSSLWGQNI